MKVYKDTIRTIIHTQYNDPLLNHLTEKIVDHLALVNGKSLLDIGCGVGRVDILAAVKGFTTVGVDIEKKVIALAKENAKRFGLDAQCKFIAGNILQQKSLSKQLFDVVICSEVIEHVSNPQEIIDFAYKVLKKNGLIILTAPNDPKLWSVLDEYAGHVKRFRVQEIKQLLSHFTILRFYTVGFPFMRIIIRCYDTIAKRANIKHSASWRQQKFKNTLYAIIVKYLLKFDDLFNNLQKGTTVVVVART